MIKAGAFLLGIFMSPWVTWGPLLGPWIGFCFPGCALWASSKGLVQPLPVEVSLPLQETLLDRTQGKPRASFLYHGPCVVQKNPPLPLLCWPSPGSRLSWLCPKAVGQSPLASRFLQQEPASSPPSTAGPPVKILCGPLQTPLPRFGFERSTHPKGCRGGPELWSGSPAFPLESSLCQLVSCSLRHLTGIHSGTPKHLLSNPLILRCLLSEHTSTILVRDLHA